MESKIDINEEKNLSKNDDPKESKLIFKNR